MNGAPEAVDGVTAVSADHLTSFQAARPRLFAAAYGVLGDAAEADDVVQDAWTRWHRTDRNEVKDATAFLATTTTRLAFNVADSARARREMPAGPWLPERVDSRADPAHTVEQRDELERAVLILMDRLSPAERAAYVLREAFDYPYREISRLLALTEANARQLVTRARARLCSRQPTAANASDHRRFVAAFVAAAETGDLGTLEELLATDVARRSPPLLVRGGRSPSRAGTSEPPLPLPRHLLRTRKPHDRHQPS